jgi:hypothetical protein
MLVHPVFAPQLKPVILSISKSSSLSSGTEIKVKVNGVSMNPGNYRAIPGTYFVESPGYKLVADTKLKITTDGDSASVVVGQQINYPAGAKETIASVVDQQARECLKVSGKGASSCFGVSQVRSAAEAVSGTVPDNSGDYDESAFAGKDSKCVAGTRKDSLVSATKINSTTSCANTVSFSRTYYATAKKTVSRCVPAHIAFDGSVVQRNAANHRWENDLYWYEDADVSYDSCHSRETVQVDTRGAKLATIGFSSKVSFNIQTSGVLDGSNNFKVSVTKVN